MELRFFVTHSMAYLTRSCNRAMFIDDGQLKEIADPSTIIRMYDRIMLERNSEIGLDPYDFEEQMKSNKDVNLVSCNIEGLDDEDTVLVGEKLTFESKVYSKKNIEDIFAFVQITDTSLGTTVASLHNRHALDDNYAEMPVKLDLSAGGNLIRLSVPYVNMARGKFGINFGMAKSDSSYSYDDMLVYARSCARFKVVWPGLFQNVSLELPTKWSNRPTG